jgi:predicted dehydrogenase
MTHRTISRRQFHRTALGAAVAAASAPAFLRGQNLNSKLNIAIIGSGGRGAANLGEKSVAAENIVVLCDVNAKALDGAAGRHPKAKKFTDFRKVFDSPADFDAVIVSTCEHTHAFATMLALKHGKHVYCEKPLTHGIWEARKIREAAAANPKLATQMGIQIHATENYHRVVELVQSGLIGPVRDCHVWVGRAWGLQSEEASKRNKDIIYVTDRPKEAMPVPPNLDWDLWLGPAPERPFHDVYFPGPKWYRWWDFGSGTMSDLGSHWNDLPFWALKLDAPLTVEGKSDRPAHPEIAPASMTAVYEYGPRGELPPVKLTWYQGDMKPEILKSGGIPNWNSGCLFVGDKGMILADYNKHVILPEKDFKDVPRPPQTIAKTPSHQGEWVEACKSGKQPSANFDYSGRLTEANHLASVAYRVGKKLEWDAANLRATNAPEADKLIHRAYRKGWEL